MAKAAQNKADYFFGFSGVCMYQHQISKYVVVTKLAWYLGLEARGRAAQNQVDQFFVSGLPFVSNKFVGILWQPVGWGICDTRMPWQFKFIEIRIGVGGCSHLFL